MHRMSNALEITPPRGGTRCAIEREPGFAGKEKKLDSSRLAPEKCHATRSGTGMEGGGEAEGKDAG